MVCPDCGSLPNKCLLATPGQGSCRGLVMQGTDLKDPCYCDHCMWLGHVKDLRAKPQKGIGMNKPGKRASSQLVPHELEAG
jgi:hypothetical protein